MRVWDSTSGYLVERLEGGEGHKDSVYSVAFSPDGHQLVSGSLDKTIKMWELTPQKGMLPGSGPKGGKCIRTFEGHKVCYHYFYFWEVLSLTNLMLGLRPQCLPNPTWRMGHEWLQRSWCSVLGSPDRRCADDASRSQKLGHFRRTMPYWKSLRNRQWRYASENLELRSLHRGETIKVLFGFLAGVMALRFLDTYFQCAENLARWCFEWFAGGLCVGRKYPQI